MSAPSRGFTLIELMVIISIIAILSVIGIVTFSNIQKNARDVKRRADIDAISKALLQYRTTRGFYPPSGNAGSAGWSCGITMSPWSNCGLIQSELGSYMSSLPFDPSDRVVSGGNVGCNSARCYFYSTPDNAHSKFYLGAMLENPPAQRPPVCQDGFGNDSRFNYCTTSSF